jgi:hypothetical protein
MSPSTIPFRQRPARASSFTRLALTIAAFLAMCRPELARAANIVWNGGTGVWGTGSNWVGGFAPGASDVAMFTGSTTACSINASVSVAGISIAVGVTVTQAAGVTVTTSGNFTQSAGTFNGGNSTVTIGGDLALSGGTFKSTSGRLEIAGAFNRTAGTFTHNSGQVMLKSNSSKTFASNGATFYDLNVNDGLRGYWKLDDTASPAVDSSGYGNNLNWTVSPTSSTTVAPTLFQSSRSLATIMADRDSALIAMPSNMQMALPITLSAWYKATAIDTNAADIISGRDSYVLRLTSTGIGLAKHTGGDVWVELSSTTSGYLDGNWHHVAGVFGSTGGMTVYYDGAVVASNADTTAISYANTAGANLAIGRNGSTNTNCDFGGNIDDVRVYSRMLTASEINSLYLGNQPATSAATQTLTGAPAVLHDLVIASGTLAGGANAISVGGSWWNYGGRFTGTGTVTFNGTGSGNVIRSAGQPFSAITVSGSGTWTLADRLWVPGGAIAVSAGTLAASAYVIHAGTLSASGGTYSPGTGTVVLDSASNQTSGAASFGGLRVEDPTESNLVGYWKLDEGQGTSLRDHSGNGNTGTLVNGPKWGTSVPSAIGFDDPAAVTLSGDSTVNDHATITVSSLGLNPYTSHITIAFWMYYASTPTASQNALVLDSAGLLQVGFRRISGVTYLAAWNSGGSLLVSTASIPAAGWHHFAYSWDGTSSKLTIDGGSPTTTANAPTSSTVDTVWLGTYNGVSELFAGRLDDVRLYNTALTQGQIGSLAAGRYANTGGAATLTLGSAATIGGTFAIDSGSLNMSTFNLTAANSDAAQIAYVNQGTLTVGSGTATFAGGLTVQPNGTLAMATSGGTVRVAAGKALTIDGTLNASSTGATIRNNGAGSYAFSVGSTATATPTLNITGLAVQNTDSNGMWINANSGSTTTFTQFDNIAFSNGTGSRLLQIYATTLRLASNGCSFDAGTSATTTYSVTLTGNGANGTPDTTETRAVFGGATCASSFASCQASKSDDDGDNDGVGNTPASNGAVAQFVRSVGTDTAGTIVGFPTAAFDWNTFSYYSSYAAYNAASGTSPVVYVRDGTGAAQYSWTAPAGETIVGTPRWMTGGTTHYLYVALASGKVYRLIDNSVARTLTPDTTGNWAGANNPFDCGCTIVTPLTMDADNLYWGGTTAGPTQQIWTLGQSSRSQPAGSPFTITPIITSAAPALWTSGGIGYLFIGLTGHVISMDVADQMLSATNDSPGSASVWGRITIGSNGATRIFAGDDAGNMWALDPSNFTGTNKVWSYLVSGDAIQSSSYYDYSTRTIHFGTEGGKVVVLDSAGAALTGYPYTPGTSADSIRSAPLYLGGVLAIGTITGKLFLLDRNSGSGPALIRKYDFGSTESVSGIAYDPNTSRFMVSTSDASLKDGRLYYIDLVSDPTPGGS